MQEMEVQSLSWEDALEKEMATHFSILAWRIHGQKSLESYSPYDLKEFRHNGSDLARLQLQISHLDNLCIIHSFYSYLAPGITHCKACIVSTSPGSLMWCHCGER